jgi:transcriptional regulator with XRE-family HTH domain
MTIGARIKKLRERNELSGERFGELCGVSKGMVSQWENNIVTPPADRLLLLQKYFEFSIDWIYTGKISIAEEIAQRLGVKEKQAWYRAGNSLAEPNEGTNGKQ